MSFLRRGNGSMSKTGQRAADAADQAFESQYQSPVDVLEDVETPADPVANRLGGISVNTMLGNEELESLVPPGHVHEPGDAINSTLGSVEGDIVPMWRQMLRVYVSNRLAVLSSFVLVFITLACFVGPILYHTNQTNASEALFQPQNLPPSIHHLFGTDNNGWDELGRVMFGGEYSLTLGFLAGFITIVVGTTYGMVSGYFGGFLDAIMMRILDALLSIPYLFLLIALIAVFHNSTTFLICIIGFTGWWGNARIIRGDALAIRDLEFSQASTSMGGSKWHIIRKHVFPNSISNIVTVGTFSIADAILFLSSLGFLGLGILPPPTDWGTMLTQGVNLLVNGYWWEVYPVSAVFIIVVVCINYIGDALRDIFEVRLRER
jgi:peptide/nickel transport system permease protein